MLVSRHAGSGELTKTFTGAIDNILDLQDFETLGGFKRFTELLAVGLQTGREALKVWKEDGRLPTGLIDDVKGASAIKRGNSLRYARDYSLRMVLTCLGVCRFDDIFVYMIVV